MSILITKGSISQSVDIYIYDNTTGLATTGLVFNTAGLVLSYRRESSVVVNITLVTLAALTTTWTDSGFIEIENGHYRLDVPDAAFTAGSTTLLIEGSFTSGQVYSSPIQLTDFDVQDAVRAGLTALPNVVAGALNGLPLGDANSRVDLGSLVGVAQSVVDLKDFADAGYDPVTNKVQGVVLVDATTTNNDKTGYALSATGLDLILSTATSFIAIAKAIWDALTASHQVVGSFGEQSDNILTTIGTPTNVDIATDLVDIQSSIGTIGSSSGGALPFSAIGDNTLAPIKGVTFSGTVVSGTFATTASNTTTYHNITDPTLIDLVYKFNVGGSKQAIQFNFTGFLNGANDSCNFQIYNAVAVAWETFATIPGQNQSTNISASVVPFAQHTGTGVDLGDVLVRFTCSATNPSLFVGMAITDAISVIGSAGYAGMISVNTIGGGQAGQNPQINGTIDNPIISMADMDSLLVAKNFTRVDVQGNSNITFTTDQISRVFTGFNWILALGGVDITNSYFKNTIISGIGTSTGGVVVCEQSRFNSCTLPPVMARECGFLAGAVITAGRGGTYTWFEGHNMDTFTGSVVFDFNRVVNTVSLVKMQWKPGSGSITIKNMKATDECSIYGNARLIIDSTCDQGGLINAHNSSVIDNVVGGFVAGGGTLTKGDLTIMLELLADTQITGDITAATSGASFTISNVKDRSGNAITLTAGMFAGQILQATTRSGQSTLSNVRGQKVLIDSITLGGIVTVKVDDIAEASFDVTPNIATTSFVL